MVEEGGPGRFGWPDLLLTDWDRVVSDDAGGPGVNEGMVSVHIVSEGMGVELCPGDGGLKIPVRVVEVVQMYTVNVRSGRVE